MESNISLHRNYTKAKKYESGIEPVHVLFCADKIDSRSYDLALEMYKEYGDKKKVTLYVQHEEMDTLLIINSLSVMRPDLVVIFGGDGTLMKLCSSFLNVPILPINTGTVGFFSEIGAKDALHGLKQIFEGKYNMEENHLMQATLKTPQLVDVHKAHLIAVNDITIRSTNPGKLIHLQISVDNQPLYSIRGDGVVISTTLGSSAYAHSAGGSIVSPGLDCIIIVPICSFMSTAPPLVLNSSYKITIYNSSSWREGMISVDGGPGEKMPPDSELAVTLSQHCIYFARFSEFDLKKDYITRLREKVINPNRQQTI